MAMRKRSDFIPAMGFVSLARLYDPLMRLAMRENEFKSRLIQQAELPASGAFLDLGCGTATLTVMIKTARPAARVFGLDGDPRILDVARKKIVRMGMDIRLDLAYSYAMPYADGSFERVLTSLVLHHLSAEQLELTLDEVLRVLKPGGELHIADFAGGHGGHAVHHRPHFHQPSRTPSDQPTSQLEAVLADKGFNSVQHHSDFPTLLGKIGYFSGKVAT